MVKSMNPDLLDPKEVMIGKLKSKIEAFKKYDAERKVYYKDALIRLGELESLIDEADLDRKLRDKIKAQRKTITGLQAALYAKGVEFPSDFDLIKAKAEIVKLQNNLNKTKKELLKHKKTISELVSKLYQNKEVHGK